MLQRKRQKSSLRHIELEDFTAKSQKRHGASSGFVAELDGWPYMLKPTPIDRKSDDFNPYDVWNELVMGGAFSQLFGERAPVISYTIDKKREFMSHLDL